MVIKQIVKISFTENEFMIIKELIEDAKVYNSLQHKLLVQQFVNRDLNFAIKIKGLAYEVSIKNELSFSDHCN